MKDPVIKIRRVDKIVGNTARLIMQLIAIISLVQAANVRDKRSLINFFEVVKCATGRNPFSYNSYGCYCGQGGSGEPVDDIDRCCYQHDKCYQSLRERGVCNKITRYTENYNWECLPESKMYEMYQPYLSMFNLSVPDGAQNSSLCSNSCITSTTKNPLTKASDKGVEKKYPVCKSGSGGCGIGLCFCDAQVALCFSQYIYPKTKSKCPKR